MSDAQQATERPVIVGVGLTQESSYVLNKVKGLLGGPERIVAVHVEERSSYVKYVAAEAMTSVEDSQVEMLHVALAELRALCEPAGITRYFVLEGNPAARLHDVAREHDARAIAVGSHGFHGWRTLLGETANSVLYGAPCDVLAIMSRDHASQPSNVYRNILVAVDMTPATAAVVEAASRVRDRYGAKVTLLSVVQPFSHAYPSMDVPVVSDPTLSFEIEAEQHYRSELAELAGQHEIDDYEVRHGSLASEVHQMVESNAIDLVVMGSHARHGLGALGGAAPNNVLHGLTCDLLAVHL